MGINIKDPSNNNILLDAPAANVFTINSSGTERVRVDSSGNLGIGTSSPTFVNTNFNGIHVNSPSGTSIKLSNAASGASSADGFEILLNTSNEAFVWNRESTSLVFGTSSTERMRIDGSGNVGIGTNSPQSLLDIKNGTSYSSTGTFLTKIQQNTNAPGHGGLSVMNAWASPASTIFEAAMGWNGTAVGYYPVFSIDGVGNITVSNPANQELRLKLPPLMTLEAPVRTNAQTSSYTLILTDAGRLIEINSASATTLTIPADASVNFPVGTKIDVLQTGTGQITIAGSGFTPNATPGLKISAQWGAASLVKRGTNSWVVIGNLSA